MNRREFIKGAALLGASFAVNSNMVENALAADGPLVIKATGGDPAKLVQAAVGGLGGMSTFVTKGQTVVVKPNIGWDRTPEQGANTHPDVVREVVTLCLAAGAAKVKIFDRTCNDPRRCYVTSGISGALEGFDSRVELTHIDERRFRIVEMPEALLLKRSSFYEDALDADCFINLPVAKHHSASGLTIGMKNIMGVLGGNRAVLHRNLPEALFDMNRAVRSHLTIVDATRILVANGPQGGKLEDVRQTQTVIASSDIVAADSIAATLFGKSYMDLKYLLMAHDKGLGIADPARIRLKTIGV